MKRRLGTPDMVILAGVAIGLLSFLTGWLTLKPNRIVTGTSFSMPQSSGWVFTASVILLWLICFTAAFLKDGKIKAVVSSTAANLALISVFLAAGAGANNLLAGQGASSRVSLGAGFWLTLAAVFVVIFAGRRLDRNVLLKNLLSWGGILVAAGLLLGGFLNNISVIQEYTANQPRFIQELVHHFYLVGVSLITGIILGVLFGIWAARNRYAAQPIFFLANIAQTIPGLALFGLLIAPLAALSFAYPFLRNIGIRGVGDTPAIIALVIYSILPIARNTYTGLRQVDGSVIDAGTGIGMSGYQVFQRIEVPLSAPVVLEGIRIAAVQSVGLAALAALIGAGGLGFFVFEGLGQSAPDLILLGAIPIIIIALAVNGIMRYVITISTPAGVRGAE